MAYRETRAFALATPNIGELNQLLGGLRAVSEISGRYDADVREDFLLPCGAENLSKVKETVYFSSYDSYESFCCEVYKLLDAYFQRVKAVPKIFIASYVQGQNRLAEKNVDMLCRAVKEYYQQYNLGSVLTTVLTSRLHKYKYVDLINVPKHLLTFSTRIRLLQDKELRKRVLITIGTINDFSRKKIEEKHAELIRRLSNFRMRSEFFGWFEKFDNYVQKQKKAVVCLGGRVEGPEIVFDINYAKKLFSDAEKLVAAGYGVFFVNSSRTPNEVTDYLYERALEHPSIIFFNCKMVAEEEEDRLLKRWRIYSGKYEQIFKRFAVFGNVYPGILGYGNTMVVHTLDSYASCETANAGIPTAISSKGLYIDSAVRYDCLNLRELLCPKYAIDWDEFVGFACNMRIEPKDLNPHVLSNPLRVFAEMAVSRLKLLEEAESRSASV